MDVDSMGLQPYTPQQEIIIAPSHSSPQLTMEDAALEWVKTKAGRSNSQKTKDAYWNTYSQFKAHLAHEGLALDGDPRAVARVAQDWAVASVSKDKLSTSSINQRFAIISSYYLYAMKHGACERNPIEFCERPPRQVEAAAPDLDADYVSLRLDDIDTRTLEGKRDMALISVALTTGRRASELAGLEWGHITRQGNKMRIKWVRCKGGKVMEDDIKAKTAKHLLRYIQALYGPLEQIAPDAPIFVSLSNRKRLRDKKHLGLSHQSISRIFLARLGVSQVHATRHTFAVSMSEAGASLEEIGDRLGHSNYKVTADYMRKRKAAQNKHGDALEAMFGL